MWFLLGLAIIALAAYGATRLHASTRHLDSLADPDNPIWDRDWSLPATDPADLDGDHHG